MCIFILFIFNFCLTEFHAAGRCYIDSQEIISFLIQRTRATWEVTITVLWVSQRYASSPCWKEHTSKKETTLISKSLWKTRRETDFCDTPMTHGVWDKVNPPVSTSKSAFKERQLCRDFWAMFLVRDKAESNAPFSWILCGK